VYIEPRNISEAFVNPVRYQVLDAEVRSNAGITTPFIGVDYLPEDDAVHFLFDVEPSDSEKLLIDSICLGHPVPPTLDQYKYRAIGILGNQVTEYHSIHYDQPQRESFVMYYQTAIQDGLVNRAAFVRTVMDWTSALQLHYVACAGQVLAAQDEAGVDAVSIDLASWEMTHPDPRVTIPAVLSIPD